MVIGIGINVNLQVDQHSEIASIATSLSDQLSRQVPRAEVLRAVLVEMDRLYADLPNGERLLNQWKNNLVTIGLQVQVNMGNQIYTGLAESVTDNGSLMIREKDGHLVKIIAGDVMLR